MLEIVNKKHDDKLALEHLSLIDMERVIKSLDYLAKSEDNYLKAALFRDAVISYAKPFSDNRFSDQTKGLRISYNYVPKEMKSLHKEVLTLRNELIAHTDMALQNPNIEEYEDRVGKNYSMTILVYETIYKDHLIEPLYKLAKAVHGSLVNSRSKSVENDF